MPLSDDAPPRGMEIEFARMLAARLGTEAQFHWQSARAGFAEQALFDRRCDAVLGAIVESDTLAPAQTVPGITLTTPYYSAGYVLIRSVNTEPVRRLDELGDERIAVEMDSISIYTLKQRGRSVFAVDGYESVIAAVADGRTRYGYLWGPVAAWELRDRGDLVIDGRFESDERWAFAMAVRQDDSALRGSLDRAIVELAASGDAAPLFERFGVSPVDWTIGADQRCVSSGIDSSSTAGPAPCPPAVAESSR